MNKSPDCIVKSNTQTDDNSRERVNSYVIVRRFCKLFKTQYDSKHLVLLTVLCFGSVLTSTAASLDGPFFPSVAEQRGISDSWIGVINGIINLGFIIGSILSRYLLSRYKPKNVLKICVFIFGLSICGFGSLEWCFSAKYFIPIAIFIQLVIGFQMGTYFTTSYTIIYLEFTENLNQVYAKIEVYYSIGLIIGPPLAGFVFQLGETFGYGFCVPFYVFAFLALVMTIVIHLTVKTETLYENKGNISYWQLMSKGGILVNVLVTMNAGALIGFNTTTLELHLEDIANLSPSMVGLVFLISGVSLVTFNHIFEHLAHKIKQKYVISLIGCLSALICLTIIGPIPMIEIEPQLYLVIISQIFLGLGISALLVGAFEQGTKENRNNVFVESSSTTAILSSLFTTWEALGDAFGPVIGGTLMESFDYSWSSFPFFALQLILITIITLFYLWRKFTNKKEDITLESVCYE
ncbi:MFS-type transporter SLC18B1-like [Oppia nitens]|uniref:MFS-type transporter SLC18B1-like n=1 Tax=Oppia nitens TaxID=1686743 RepID=UPI0023D98CF0|nr:MFS-type transporter SLC18B1-like [Oppia nitens]